MVIRKQCVLALIWLSTFSLYSFASATATVDRNAISIDETFQLKLTLDETSFFGTPDISLLEDNFEILGTQKSSQTSYINGKKSAITSWNYQLAPKHEGILTIPSIEIDGEKTQALSIKVTATKNRSGADIQAVFMEATTDKKSVYVQEQLLLTVQINTSLNLHNLQLDNLNIENAFVMEVSNTQFERSLNNTPYITYEIVYAIFPQNSGTLSIPALASSGINASSNSFNGFFGGGKTLRMQSAPLTIDVKAMPSNANGDWLPAKSLILKETWSANPDSIKVGDSITRTITTTAEGLAANQLPPIIMQGNTHYKVYPDQPALADKKGNEGLTGERKDAITLLATEPGQVTLPAISVQWWDIDSNTLKTETLPPVTIHITGEAIPAPSIATGSTSIPDTNTEPSSSNPSSISAPVISNDNISGYKLLAWQISTAISSCIALAFFALYMRIKQRIKPITTNNHTGSPSSNGFLKSLRIACQNNEPQAIRLALLEWTRYMWPNAIIHSTADISRVMNDKNMDAWIKRIDAHLYNNNSATENWLALYELIKEKQSLQEKMKTTDLAPLYPK